MSNIYTRSGIPRTTMLTDYGFKNRVLAVAPPTPKDSVEFLKLESPCRRQNPQPMGLVYQSAYNIEDEVFGIWNHNKARLVGRYKDSIAHLCATNFSCKHDPDVLRKKLLPPGFSETVRRQPPDIKYTRNTTQRHSYRWPSDYPEKFRDSKWNFKIRRPCDELAVGIVPDIMVTAQWNDDSTTNITKSKASGSVSNFSPITSPSVDET